MYKLQELRATDLDNLYAELLRAGGVGGPLSMTSVHHVHALVGKMLHDAERQGLVVRNVARLSDAPSMAAARNRAREMNVWSPGELSRFLRYVENYRAGVLVHLAAMTGMRRAELVALRWDSVDLARSTVTVRAAASFLGGSRSTSRSSPAADHIPVAVGAPLVDFVAVADRYPVFEVRDASAS